MMDACNYNYNYDNNFTSQSLAMRVNQANKAVSNFNSKVDGARLTLVVGLVASVSLAIFASIAIGAGMLVTVVGIAFGLTIWAKKDEREVKIFEKALKNNLASRQDVERSFPWEHASYPEYKKFIYVSEDGKTRVCKVYKTEKDTPGFLGSFEYSNSTVIIS